MYGIESVLKEFHGAMQYLQNASIKVGVPKSPLTLAFADSRDNSITLSIARYNDYKKLGKEMKEKEAKGWFAKGSTATSTARHEAGHLVSYAVARKMGYDISNPTIRNKAMKQIILNAMKNPAVQKWMKENKYDMTQARMSISRYAGKAYSNNVPNYNETVAEAVNDWMNNRSKANVLSRAIVQEMKKELRR